MYDRTLSRENLEQKSFTTTMSNKSSPKELAWEAYLEGYKKGYNVESYSNTIIRTARSEFERWWKRNNEYDND